MKDDYILILIIFCTKSQLKRDNIYNNQLNLKIHGKLVNYCEQKKNDIKEEN